MLLDKIIAYGFLGSITSLCVWWMLISAYIDFTFRPSKEVIAHWLERDWSAVTAIGLSPTDSIRSAMYSNHKNSILIDNKINASILFGGAAIVTILLFASFVLIGLDITGFRKINLGA